MDLPKGQLTARGVAVGCVGCAVITAASAYTALKMGALPWPIVFAAIVSLFFLKALGRGRADLHEANVTHTVMSAGSMVAGGLAFTVPGAWMLGHADETAWPALLAVALGGTVLGLACAVPVRRRFIVDEALEFPIGQAAAQTLVAGEVGGSVGRTLFGALGLAGAYAWLRDGLGALPTVFFSGVSVPGVSFGVYNSPLMMSMGFLVGTSSVVVWLLGAIVGSFGVVAGGTALGLWDAAAGQGIASSLGMGAMMGCGFAVVAKMAAKALAARRVRRAGGAAGGQTAPASVAGRGEGAPREAGRALQGAGQALREAAVPGASRAAGRSGRPTRVPAGLAALAAAAAALLVCFAAGLSPLVSVVVVLLSFVTCAMSAQCVGQTGIDPMEIFGLIVLLFVAAFSETPEVQLFYVAAVIAVACGLAGDVMNDFKAGHVLGTDFRAQWIGQAIGSVLGAFVSVGVMLVLLAAYGADAFGSGGEFVAAQASVLATMVAGIPSAPAFLVGLAAGFSLYLVGAPAMMLGLGIYLPFYMTAGAAVGLVAKVVYNAVGRRRQKGASPEERAELEKRHEQAGLVVASGLLGGESVMGVLIALYAIATGLAG